MRYEKGFRTKTVFLFVLFIGAISVCFQNTSVQAGLVGEQHGREESLTLIQEGQMIVSQAEKEPAPPPSWMGPKTPGTPEAPEKTAPEPINPKALGSPPPSVPIQVTPPARPIPQPTATAPAAARRQRAPTGASGAPGAGSIRR